MSESVINIKIVENGPARIECKRAEITLPDGSIVSKEGLVVLCRCGESNKKPFCDGAHKTCGFTG